MAKVALYNMEGTKTGDMEKTWKKQKERLNLLEQ